MRACLAQPPLIVREWIVKLRTIIVFVLQSRIVLLVCEVINFVLILVLLFLVESKASVKAFVVVSLILLLPLAVVSCLYVYILLGRCLYITDEDLDTFWEYLQEKYQECKNFLKSVLNAVFRSFLVKESRGASEIEKSRAHDLDNIYATAGKDFEGIPVYTQTNPMVVVPPSNSTFGTDDSSLATKS